MIAKPQIGTGEAGRQVSAPVAVPTLNGALALERALAAVRAQTADAERRCVDEFRALRRRLSLEGRA